MAFLSQQEHVSDGTLQSVSFSIAFLDKAHLHFYIGNDEVTSTIPVGGVLVQEVTNYVVTLTAPVPNGSVFSVRRVTPRTSVPHKFNNGAALFNAANTDENNTYTLFIVQEGYEQSGNGPFPNTTTLDGTELLYVNVGGVRKQITISNFLDQAPDVVLDGFKQDLANDTDPLKGVGMVGGAPRTVADISAVRAMPKTGLTTSVTTLGYTLAGKGAGNYRLDLADTSSVDNGVTVIVATDGGRWKLQHDGTIYASQAGAAEDGTIDDTVPIQSILSYFESAGGGRVLGGTCLITAPLIYTGDGLMASFDGLVYNGVSAAFNNSDTLRGLISIVGATSGAATTLTLSADVADGDDFLTLPSVASFSVGEYWRVRPTASEWGPVSFMVEITRVDALNNKIYFNYRCGWPVASGTSYDFQKVIPAKDCSIEIGAIVYQTTESGTNGLAGVAEQYTVNCSSVVKLATNTKYPVIMKRWSLGGVSSALQLNSPQDITTGGTGYGVHHIHCLYTHIADTKTSESRHVFDWSGCAYCTAENVHSSGTMAGATDFSCHQAFDHDCELSNFSGWLSWANDLVFGRSMKRMTARKGIAKGQLATFHTSPDCTFEDVRVIGDIIINADGATLRNVVQSGGTTRFNQTSTASVSGKTVIDSSKLIPWIGGDWIPAAITSPLQFIGGSVGPVNGALFRGVSIDCEGVSWTANSTPGLPAYVHTNTFNIVGGSHSYNAWRILGAAVDLSISGGVFGAVYNDTSNAFVDCRITTGTAKLTLNGLSAKAATTSSKLIYFTGGGGTLRLSCQGLVADSGSIEINSTIGAAGSVNFTGTTTVGTNYSRPAAGARVSYSGELLL